MDERTLQALKDSIAKWEKNARVRKVENATVRVSDCPLCLMFHSRFFGLGCRGCPVSEATDQIECDGTPYEEANNRLYQWRDDSCDGKPFRAAARAEVDFLKSLLPEDQS
ncbi:MAG: hypothetical protein ACPG4X_17000 [Pikeienuella sp.]